MALSIYHKTAPYVKGFKAGLAFKNFRDICGEDNTKASITCNDAYEDAQNTLPWTYRKTYMFGCWYGKLGAEGKASHNICEKGWNASFDSVPAGHRHIDD
jgi:hypothetical protein